MRSTWHLSRGCSLVILPGPAACALELAVYLVSGVMDLVAKALHSLSYIFVSGFLLMAAVWSRKEADEVHLFGHGRAQNVAALVAATLFMSIDSSQDKLWPAPPRARARPTVVPS